MTNQTKARLAKGKKLGGRPSSYKPEYCKAIIKFFDIEPYKEVVKKRYTRKDGEICEEFALRANDLRFFSQFSRSIGVSTDSLNAWCTQYPEFSVAYNSAKEMQKEHLVINGLQENFSGYFSVFTAKNITDMRDKVESEVNVNFSAKMIMEVVQSADKEHTKNRFSKHV